MCGPLAAFAVSALSSVASFVGSVQEANAVSDAASAAYEVDQQQADLRAMQESEATAQKLQAKRIEEAKGRAEVEVSAAEGGVAGISVDNILADVTRQAATARQTERQNLDMTVQQLQMQKKASRAQNQGRINQAASQVNPFSLVAGIAGAGVDAYANSRKITM